MLKILFKYKLSLALQSAIAFLFLYILVRINSNINAAESKLIKAQETNAHLKLLLAGIESDSVSSDSTKHLLAVPDSLVKKNSILSLGRATRDIKYPFHLDSPRSTKKTSVANTSLPVKQVQMIDSVKAPVTIYECRFLHTILIKDANRITDMSSSISLTYNNAHQPKIVHTSLLMHETGNPYDSDPNQVSSSTFQCLQSKISNENVITLVFKEPSKPAVNEFGLPSYQRNLTLTLSGLLSNNFLDALLTWEEVSGMPRFARMKFSLTAKQ